MKQLKKLVSGCLVLLLPAVAIAKSHSIKQDGRWSSRVLVSGSGTIFRASTTSYRNSTLVALTFDRYIKKCSTQYITMNFVLDRRATKSYTRSNLFGQMRVDRHKMHNINYKMRTTSGSKYGYVYVTNFGRKGNILRELNKGTKVRFKLASAGGKEYYFNFSLPGFQASSARARRLCFAHVRGKDNNSDSQYFKPKPKPKAPSDKDYFL